MKLKRGQKQCANKECGEINAARQRICTSCNQPFVQKWRPIKNEILNWKELAVGDHFRVVNGTGPYYLLDQYSIDPEFGDRMYVGGKGRYEVKGISEHGIEAWSVSPYNHAYEFIYMGAKTFAEETQIYRRPHRIVKVNSTKSRFRK